MIIQEEVIYGVPDSVIAKRVLDEMVVAGGHQATELRDGFVVYSKNNNGEAIEELFIRKIGDNDFQIIKRTIKGDNK